MPKLLEKMKLKIELYFAKKKMDREHFKLVDSPDYGGRTHHDADPIKYEKARRKYESFRDRVKADVKPLDARGIKTDVDLNKNNREIVD